MVLFPQHDKDSALVHPLHHDRLGGFDPPTHIQLLRSHSPAMGAILEVRYVLPAQNKLLPLGQNRQIFPAGCRHKSHTQHNTQTRSCCLPKKHIWKCPHWPQHLCGKLPPFPSFPMSPSPSSMTDENFSPSLHSSDHGAINTDLRGNTIFAPPALDLVALAGLPLQRLWQFPSGRPQRQQRSSSPRQRRQPRPLARLWHLRRSSIS